jgi:hypothetical protein
MALERHRSVRQAEPAGRRGVTLQQRAMSEVHPVELAEFHDVRTHGTGHRVGSPEHPEAGGTPAGHDFGTFPALAGGSAQDQASSESSSRNPTFIVIW